MAAKIDVTRESEWVGLIAKAVAIYGKLDILVNNAGISGSSVRKGRCRRHPGGRLASNKQMPTAAGTVP